MYFSYLRCKQFELLALKEIAPFLLNKLTVSPILEPVKSSTGSFERTLESLVANNINFTIIINPAHGEFTENSQGISDMINIKLAGYDNFQLGLILNQTISLEGLTTKLQQIQFPRSLSLIHADRVNDIEGLSQWCQQYSIRYNLYGENFPVRRYRNVIMADTKVLLDDKFRPQQKNADYINFPDEFFSDDYRFFRVDGFTGFGDFLTIGDDFGKAGRQPYAVAIHLTYMKENGEIWIRHFVSDSNTDTNDVAGKFGEALEKLIAFIDDKNITTLAANEFRELNRNGHYPGLGSLKKLSIMNHIELMYNLLNN